MIEIIINRSYKLDGFNASEVIALTFAEAKFNNLVTRGGTFSNKIKLAKTANNRQALGFPEDNRETSVRPYTLFECEIKIGRNPVFYGVAILEQAQDFYELRVFSGLADFFKLLNDKTLPELDLSDLNHEWFATDVRAATNSATDYCYPAINYGRWTGTKASRANTDFFPAVYFKRLLESSASELGWTLNNYDSNWAIPFSKQQFGADRSIRYKVQPTSDYTQSVNSTYMEPEDFDNVIEDPLSREQLLISTNSLIFETIEDGSYDVKLYLKYDYTPLSGSVGVQIIATADTLPGSGGAPLSGVFPLSVGSHELTIEVEGVQRGTGGANFLFFQFIIISGASTSLDVDADSYFEVVRGKEPNIPFGRVVPVADTLPEIKCKDLFLFEAVRQNALILADPIAKTLEFVPFDTIADRWGAARDWTNKVDLTIKPKYEYRLTDYAQVNELRWKDGTDEDLAYKANNELGNSSIDIDDGGLDDTKVEYTAPFAASVRRSSFTDNTHAYIPRYSDSSLAYDNPDINPVVRAMPLVSSTDNLVQITSASAVTDQMQGFPETWAEIKADNYTSFEAMLNRLKLVTVQVNLTAEDIASLDFTYPVKMLGNYWFLQEVKQWKANKAGTTTVKAIRL